MTSKDVAARAGVAQSTVSYVMSGKRSISPRRYSHAVRGAAVDAILTGIEDHQEERLADLIESTISRGLNGGRSGQTSWTTTTARSPTTAFGTTSVTRDFKQRQHE
ncbi:LacI family DNA-binding transcriptional regulator [Streptomyces sp. NPDC048438]|uniref:LacI family DNA-binding transcriptional regulator n=1 Tax=Streptomyces sp. NPDC048438 TaxID=3365551 RepID=UPI0037212DBD